MEELNEICGELGEIIEPYSTVMKTEGEEDHAVVGLDIDGFVHNEDGTISLFLSPEGAEDLAKKLIEKAKEANNSNYHLLRHKPPF